MPRRSKRGAAEEFLLDAVLLRLEQLAERFGEGFVVGHGRDWGWVVFHFVASVGTKWFWAFRRKSLFLVAAA